MSALLAYIISNIGRLTDATSASGSLAARVLETLNRFTTTIAGRIDAAVSGRVTTSIKSIQRGTITIAVNTTSNTATISAVTTGKTRLTFLGSTGYYDCGSGVPSRWVSQLALTNGTTVTASKNQSNATYAHAVGYEVVEYF